MPAPGIRRRASPTPYPIVRLQPVSPHGLGVVPGPIDADADVGATPFEPGESVAEQGKVRPEIVWSVLDCPSYTPSMWHGGIVNGGAVSLLGRFTAQRLRDVAVGEQLVVVGWPIGFEGRRRIRPRR